MSTYKVIRLPQALERKIYLQSKGLVKDKTLVFPESRLYEEVIDFSMVNDFNTVQSLVSQGVNIDKIYEDTPPYQWSMFHKNNEMTRYLIGKMSTHVLNHVNETTGMNAVHAAILYQQPEILSLLIERGCDLYQCDVNGKNSLDLAKQVNNPEIIKLINDNALYYFCVIQ